MPKQDGLSRIDLRILDILQRDGRASFADIGAAVGMSAPSAHERVKKLEAPGRDPGLWRPARCPGRWAGASSPSAGSASRPGPSTTDLTEAFSGAARDRGVPPHRRRGRLPAQGPGGRHARPRAGHEADPGDPVRVHDRDRRRLLERVRAATAGDSGLETERRAGRVADDRRGLRVSSGRWRPDPRTPSSSSMTAMPARSTPPRAG